MMRILKPLVLTACLWAFCSVTLPCQVHSPITSDATDAAPTAGQPITAGTPASVPRLMKFNGTLRDAAGKPLSGAVDVTFYLYSTESGGDALWFETQSVQADELGRYTALLGAMHADGLPTELFTSGEVRWLGIQVGHEPEQQPRVLLVSVPYALKAGDAETLGGKPASAYMLSDSQKSSTSTTSVVVAPTGTTPTSATGGTSQKMQASGTSAPLTACASVTSNGTAVVNYIPVFTTACNIQNSILYQVNGRIGMGTTTPQAVFHMYGPASHDADAQYTMISTDTTSAAQGVGGGITFAGFYNGTASKAGFANIRGVKENGTQGNYASALIFDTRVNGGNQTERMRITSAGNVGIGTSTPAAKLEVNGTAKFDQAVTFASSQNFGSSSTVLTGSTETLTGSTANQVLNVNQAGTGAAAVLNTTGSGEILSGRKSGVEKFGVDGNGNVTISGNLNLPQTTSASAGVISMGSNPLIHICCGSTGNIFVGGSAGNFSLTGSSNTAMGQGALFSLTTGSSNTAVGSAALEQTTTGAYNTSTGFQSMVFNTSGVYNTANGFSALPQNTTGSANTATGAQALFLNTTGNNNTATGTSALLHSNGDNNTGDGFQALYSTTTGGANTASGFEALFSNTTGSNNVVAGFEALYTNTTANINTALGYEALYANSDANANTAVGDMALYYNCSGASSSCAAIDNTALGYNAGAGGTLANANKTGSFNTFLGANSAPGTTTQLTNATAIGANATVSQNNSLVLGSINGVNGATSDIKVGIGTATPLAALQVATGDIVMGPVTALPYSGTNGVYVNNDSGDAKNTFRLDAYKDDLSIAGFSNGGAATGTTITFRTGAAGAGESNRIRISSTGELGIGTMSPAYPLDVVGDIHTTGCVMYNGGAVGSCATPSDARLKMNIQPFDTVLKRLVALRPVHFDWNPSNPPKYRFAPGRTPGLIAQDVEKVFPEMVTTGEDGYKKVFYNELQFMLLEGVRELETENNKLKDSALAEETEIKEQKEILARQQNQIKQQQDEISRLMSQMTVIQATLKAKPHTHRTVRVAKSLAAPAPTTGGLRATRVRAKRS